MIREFILGIKRSMLLFGSAICIYGAYLGLCTRSANNHVNNIRGSDSVIWAFAAVLVIMFGSFLFYRLCRTYGKGDLKKILGIGLMVSGLMLGYGHFVAADMIVVDVKDFVKAPVVAGYEREGYVEEGPGLDRGKVDATIEAIDNEEDRAHLEHIIETSGFSYAIYEDFQNFETRQDGQIHSGDAIYVTFEFDEEFAKRNHIAFDNVFMHFDVDELQEKPVTDWSISRDQLIDLALNYEYSIGSDANMAEVGYENENGDVEVITSYLEGDYKESRGYYLINRESLMGRNEMTDSVINFNEFN